jgi:hypothetical protein
MEPRKETGIRILTDKDNPQLNEPYPDETKIEEIYMDALRNVPPGEEHAHEYHHIMAAILTRLFVPPLSNPKVEHKIVDELKRVDIVMTNHAASGFFYSLSASYKVYAPFTFIECKNYETEIGNPEVDQLSGRLNETRGQFGILTYRKCKDRHKLLKRCQDFGKKGERIIALDDDDIIYMLRTRLDGEDIDEYLDEKMQELLLK